MLRLGTHAGAVLAASLDQLLDDAGIDLRGA
jgi:hypothetical protein